MKLKNKLFWIMTLSIAVQMSKETVTTLSIWFGEPTSLVVANQNTMALGLSFILVFSGIILVMGLFYEKYLMQSTTH